jgi:hypothetical protein
MIDKDAIRMRWEADGSKRDERGQRLFAASEARAAGWGGVAGAIIAGGSRSWNCGSNEVGHAFRFEAGHHSDWKVGCASKTIVIT